MQHQLKLSRPDQGGRWSRRQDVLFDCLSGRRRADGGEIRVQGQRLAPRTPYDAIRAGVVLVPADRLQALLPQRSVRENIAVPLYNRQGRIIPLSSFPVESLAHEGESPAFRHRAVHRRP